jgi:hypothetical protein
MTEARSSSFVSFTKTVITIKRSAPRHFEIALRQVHRRAAARPDHDFDFRLYGLTEIESEETGGNRTAIIYEMDTDKRRIIQRRRDRSVRRLEGGRRGA